MRFYVMSDGTTYEQHAWTGGDWEPPGFSHPHFIQILFFLYCEQVRHFTEFWNEPPDLDTASTFWTRAKGDAWRTFSDGPVKAKKKLLGGTVYTLPLNVSSCRKGFL